MQYPKLLTVAGSDSGGGAGIQADLKTFQELGGYGMSVITAVTAQNTLGVSGVFPMSIAAVEAQLEAVLSDIGADAVKTGMLLSPDIIRCVAERLRAYSVQHLVVDPVMLSKSGAALLREEAVELLKSELLPQAELVTPNIPEACALSGMREIRTVNDMKEAASVIHRSGVRWVLLKGGHLEAGDAVDVLYDGRSYLEFRAPRADAKHTHGTGCTLASAIACGLGRGLAMEPAVRSAKQYVYDALRTGLSIGRGIGPVHHAVYRRAVGELPLSR